MATSGACFVPVAWMLLHFSFLSFLDEPPAWSTSSEQRFGGLTGMKVKMQWSCVFAAARSPISTATGTGRRRSRGTEAGGWVFLPFSKLKYRFFGWSPVDRIVAGINMDTIYLLAGNPRGDIPRVIQATMDDLMILFFRWFDENDLVWPLQREVTKAALFREHYRYARQFLHEVTVLEQQRPAPESNSVPSVQDYRQVSAAQLRLRKWFFDGNTFTKRDGGGAKSDHLTEDDVDFMRGLPLSVLRIARGVFAPSMPASVARLSEDLKLRNITTANQLLEETNFIDFFALFDLFDEAYTQVDVLREFHRKWVNEGIVNLPQQSLPPGEWTGAQNLTDLITNPKSSPAEFPKCSTLKCFMHLKWSSTPIRSIKVEKKDVNSLKLLLVGNSGVATPSMEQSKGWVDTIKSFLGFDELQQTVAALKDWHTREKADAVLGLGSILGIPSATSVRSERFETKWYNVFVKEGGLDIPWLMTVGEDEGVLSPATPVRYHYTLQHPNWHMPNDMYTVDFQFHASMTLEDGAIQRDSFNVTIVNLNTWALLAGNPVTNNLQTQLSRMMWISRQLFAATKRNSTWLIVMGHHPVVCSGVEGKQARLQYLEDIYTGGHYRGWEHLVMQHLFFHYHVDAYISGHDYLMEYNTMEDLDTNTTISFINSGATVRLMDRSIGRGWIGRLRGALYPVMCFAGRRVLFLADPGGCEPRGYERTDALGWFAPKFGNVKVNFEERVMRATGFTSLQLTKDYMIVDFIDGRTKKPATRRLQRRTNKAVRDVTFANPIDMGRKMYEGVRQQREDFVRANLDLVRKEIYFAKRCPALAERITSYIREINSMVDRYEKTRREREAFQKMTEQEIEGAAVLGLDWDMEIERAAAEMRAVSKYYRSLKEKYLTLLAIKDTLPKQDDPRYKDLLQYEKTMMNLKRNSLNIVRRVAFDSPVEIRAHYALIEHKIAALSANIKKLEEEIKTAPVAVRKERTDKNKPQRITEDTKDQLVAQLRKTGVQLRQAEETLRDAPHGDVKAAFDRARKMKEQLETKLSDLRAQVSTYLEPLHPLFVWQKQQELHAMQAKIKHMTNYLARMDGKTASGAEAAKDDVSKVRDVHTQRQELQAQVQKLQELLEFRDVTPLQQQYLDKKAALAMAELVEGQTKYLHGEEKEVQQVKDSINLAAEAKRHLRNDLEQLEKQVNEELQKAVTAWEKQHEVQNENNKEHGSATGQEGAGESGTRTRGVEINGAGSGTRASGMARSASPPSDSSKIETRRLSERCSPEGSKASDKPRGKGSFTGLRRKRKEELSTNSPKGTFHTPDPVAPVRVRRLSVSQSVKASAEDPGTPGGSSAKTGELSGGNIDTSSEKVSRSAERRSRIQPGHREKEVDEQSGGLENHTGPSKKSPKTPLERPYERRDAAEPAETGKNTDTQGNEEKPEHTGKAAGEIPEAKRKPQRKRSSTRVGHVPATRRTPRKKRNQNVQQERSTSSEALDGLGAAGEYVEEELDKIDRGPLDGCHSIPIIDVMVRRALHPEENAESDAKCESIFADRALNRQLVTLSQNQLLSRGTEGLGASVHPVPSVHVSRGWRLYFQDTPKIMFKALMRDLKAGLSFVEKTFKRSPQATALYQKQQGKQQPAPQASQNSTVSKVQITPLEGTHTGSGDAGSEEAEAQRHRSERQSSKKLPTDGQQTDSTGQPHSQGARVLSQASKPENAPRGGAEKDSLDKQTSGEPTAKQSSITLKQPASGS